MIIRPKESIDQLIRVSEKEPSRLYKHRMDRNERTHPFSQSFMSHIKETLTDEILMAYPEPEPLYMMFSEWLGIHRDQLLFFSGSDLSIKAVFETYIRPDDLILMHSPSYAMYQVYANMFQAHVENVQYDSDLRLDLDCFIDTLSKKHRMVVIENPNGFIGNKHPMNAIKELIAKADSLGVLVLVDEAYFHFIDETAVDFIETFDNLIITRTFSKAFGLAGLRAGYLVSNRKNIDYLYRVKPMHELNSMAIFMITELLEDQDELKRFITECKKSLEYLKLGLNQLDIDTSDSCANFLAARFADKIDSLEAKKQLEQYNFLIRRPFREAHLKDWTRIGTAPLRVEEEFLNKISKLIRR